LGSRKKDKAKRLLLFRSRTRTDGHKLVYDKCHFCTFCGTKIVSKISSHLVTVHKDKEAIKSISDLPKGSRQRNLLLQTLVNEDNFKDNTSVTRRGEGEVWADEVQWFQRTHHYHTTQHVNFVRSGRQERICGDTLKVAWHKWVLQKTLWNARFMSFKRQSCKMSNTADADQHTPSGKSTESVKKTASLILNGNWNFCSRCQATSQLVCFAVM